MRNPVTIKKIGMKKRLAKEFQLVLGWLVVHRRVDRQAGEERADDTGES